MATYMEWKKEKENAKELRRLVDLVASDVMKGKISSRTELAARVDEVRSLCESMFPDRLDLFDMIYSSRLDRLWRQFRSGD